MANMKLLRQQVKDYQEGVAKDQAQYDNAYATYKSRSEAFLAAYPNSPETQVASPETVFYDTEAGVVKDIYGRDLKGGVSNRVDISEYEDIPEAKTFDIQPPADQNNHMQVDPTTGAFWDAYGKQWRNFRANPPVPVQRERREPRLTQRDIGMLQGKVSPLQMVDEAPSPNSAFADPEDPYNLKDAGILTRAIAGKF